MRRAPVAIILMCIALAITLATPAFAQSRKPAHPAAPAPAGPKPLSETLTGEAKGDYDAAKLLLSDGDFVGAEIKFQGAFDKSSDPRLLWNIAACEKQQRHYARTLGLVRRYLDTGGALLTDADRAEAKSLLDAIESFTVKLTVTVNEAGADIFIDDEKVGTSPLDAPIIVDLGNRKIVVKKAGFNDATTQVPIGGSADAHVEMKLALEVHEGHLVVTSQADAKISIDGNVVSTGRFDGKLKSGGHTLRVEAAGMVAYQSEVVLADDENRSIDVPLQKVYVPPPPAPKIDPGPGFEIGLSGGPGVKLHGDKPWMTTERLDIGFRPGWPTNLGLFFEAEQIDASGNCGTNVADPSSISALSLAKRYSFSSCNAGKAGFQIVVHMLPAHAIDPWIGFTPGFRLTLYDYRSFDPLGSPQAAQKSLVLAAIDAELRAGVDWHPVRTFRPWAIGVYVATVVTVVADEDLDNNDNNNNNNGNTPTSPSNNGSGGGPATYASFLFGARTALAF